MKLSLNSLLAKAAEYGLPLQRGERSNATLLNKAITDHEREQNELSIRTVVEAIREEEREEIKRIAGVRESISGIVSRRLVNQNLKDRFKLEDANEEIESLVQEAESYNIYDYDVNDLIDLRQKIEDAQHKAAKEGRSARNEYLASIL